MTADPQTDQIDAIRRFSRFYTRRLGLLRRRLLDSAYSLTEARILFELANNAGLTANMLTASLDLDAGYLSRMLKAFEERGLVARTPSDTDGRAMLLALTDKGRAVAEDLADKSRAQVGAMMAPLSPAERSRLVGALGEAESLMAGTGEAALVLRPHGPGDMGWVTALHGELYTREYGWNDHFEALVARICADFLDHRDPVRDRCWIAERNGKRLGCVFVVKEDETTARLRLLLVDPAARGMGLGRTLVDECLRFARTAGYRRMVLWTNHVLTSARHLYEEAGFRLVEQKPHTMFGPEVIGQSWEKVL